MADDVLGSASIPIRATLDKLVADLEKARVSVVNATAKMGEQASKSFTDKLRGAADRATETGKKMSLGLSLPILGAGAAAVHMAADFDTTMRQVAAATGAPASKLDELKALANEMGQASVFSTQEAGEAMLELAKGGMTAAQIKGGALAATMDTAAAGGLGLADASTYVINALGTFGLTADKAGAVATALAGGANASTASVESLGQALSQVGPGAKNAGLSLQETVGVLAAFDQQGIKGSDAGTSLKTMLMRLVPSTDAAAGAMRDLGLKFTDAQGNFLPIANVAQQLQDKLSGLSEEQRTAALTTIFGSDATRAATVLMQLGAQGVNKYTKAAKDQAAVQTLVAANTQGTAGAIERAKGSVETAAIAFGTVMAPAVAKVAGWIEKLANFFGALSPTMQTVLLIVGGIAAAVGPLLIVFGMAAKSVVAITEAMKILNITMMGMGWFALAAIVATVAILIITHWDQVKAALSAIWDGIKTAALTVWNFIKDHLRQIVEAIVVVVMGPMGALAVAIFENWDRIKAATVAAWNAVKGAISAAWDWITGKVKAAVAAVTGAINTAWSAVSTATTAAWNAIKAALGAVWAAITAAASAVFNGITALITRVLDGWKNIFTGAWGVIKGVVSAGVNAVVGFVASIPGRIGGALSGIASAIVAPFREAFNGIASLWNNTVGRLSFHVPSWIPGVGGKGFSVPNIPTLADGGIVTAPTLALIGEGRSDEAVIPLDSPGGLGDVVALLERIDRTLARLPKDYQLAARTA